MGAYWGRIIRRWEWVRQECPIITRQIYATTPHNEILVEQATYLGVDFVHCQYMYTSFMFEQCQPLTQWLIFKTLQYRLLFSRHTNLAVQCFRYSCQTLVTLNTANNNNNNNKKSSDDIFWIHIWIWQIPSIFHKSDRYYSLFMSDSNVSFMLVQFSV